MSTETPIRPDSMEKLAEPQCKPNEEWLLKSGRSNVFQAFLDSLETRAVRKAKAQESKPVRPVFGNYATKR